MPGRVLVCGGRDYDNWEIAQRVLDKIAPDVIIEGGARGADFLAYRYARERRIEHIEAAANWDRYGKSAGHIRNQQMLDYFKPDLVVAFPGGDGTKGMINRALRAGVPVRDLKTEWTKRLVKKKPVRK